MSDITTLSVSLNPEQQEYFDTVIATVTGMQTGLSDTYRHFTINGAAGTGKSVLVNAIRKYLEDRHYNVITLAPTNAAARIIKGVTIHRYFRIGPKDPEAPIIEFELKDIEKLVVDDPPSLILLDEVSMVNDDLLTLISEFCYAHNILLVMVGDSAQLPPVKQEFASMAFNETEFEQLTLKTIVRQGVTSSIPLFASKARTYDNIFNFRGMENNYQQIISKLNLDNDIDFYKPWNSNIIKVYQQGTVIVAHSNDQVQLANSIIHHHLHPDAKELFVIGETIISKSVISTETSKSDGSTYYKLHPIGTEFIILSAKEEEIELIPVVQDVRKPKIVVTVINASIKAIDDKTPFKVKILYYKDYNVVSKIKYEYHIALKNAKDVEEYGEISRKYKLKSNVPDVHQFYHAYASTIHLAQGKTHDRTVILSTSMYFALTEFNKALELAQSLYTEETMDQADQIIFDNAMKDLNSKLELYNKLVYVAMTRPRNKLGIMEYSLSKMKDELNQLLAAKQKRLHQEIII